MTTAPQNSDYTQRFSQSFENDTLGLNDLDGAYGSITRVESGTGGITSANGGHHVIVQQTAGAEPDPTGPFTRFDGYRDFFKGGFETTIRIYLDVNWEGDSGFDYSVAANGQDGAHQRDFIFHVTKDADTGTVLIGANNNSSFDPVLNLDTWDNYAEVSASGWYTFSHDFYENEDGDLEVSMKVHDAAGNLLFEEVRTSDLDVIATEAGGNRYGWFCNIDVEGGVAVDELALYTADDNPVLLKNGSNIIDSFATVAEAKAAAVEGDVIILTSESSVTDGKAAAEAGDSFALSGEAASGSEEGAQLIYGTSEADVLFGEEGADEVFGLDGDDILVGGSDNDRLHGGGDADVLRGGRGRDVLNGGSDNDVLRGGGARDILRGGDGVDVLSGGVGNDVLKGGAGIDVLDGGAGTDVLVGGAGRDVLTGGEGSDLFRFAKRSGDDVVTDFDVTADTLQIASGARSMKGVTVTDVDGGALVEFGESSVLLEGVAAADLTDSVFDFA